MFEIQHGLEEGFLREAPFQPMALGLEERRCLQLLCMVGKRGVLPFGADMDGYIWHPATPSSATPSENGIISDSLVVQTSKSRLNLEAPLMTHSLSNLTFVGLLK